MFKHVLLAVALSFSAVTFAADPVKPTNRPAIVSLNPSGPPVPTVTDPVLKLTSGKIQVLKLNSDLTGVTWNVIQPMNEKGTEVDVVEFAPLPKSSPAFGFMEGEASAKKHVFEVDTLCLVATGKGSGFVTVQALQVDGGAIKVVAKQVIEVKGGNPNPGPGPGPGPVDPTFPDGKFKLSATTYKLAMKEVAAGDRKAAEELSKSFSAMAASISAGAVTKPEDILSKTTDSNRAALDKAGVKREAWQAFFTAFQDEVYAMYKDKKLVTADDYATAWREVSQGLEKVK